MQRSKLRICQRDGLSVDTEEGQLLTTLNIFIKNKFFLLFCLLRLIYNLSLK